MNNSVLQTIMVVLWASSDPAANGPSVMAQRVASLVDDTVHAETEESAFAALEALGPEGVPYIVSHLGDTRALPIKAISLVNHASDAFEGMRHYGPETVHDALSAILNQITGQSFESVFNGGTAETRARDAKAWREWCVKAYPRQARTCEHGI